MPTIVATSNFVAMAVIVYRQQTTLVSHHIPYFLLQALASPKHILVNSFQSGITVQATGCRRVCTHFNPV